MRIIVAASGEFAVPLLRSLVRAGYEIPFVLTQPDRQAGRGKRVRPTPVRQAADELNLEVIATPDVNSPDTIDLVASSGARLGLAVAFGQKIGPALLTSLPAGWLNAHASLLPAYRGAAPIQRAILGGCETTGVTVFRLTERMDAGPIVLFRRTGIRPEETAGELHDRLAAIACDAVKAALPLFETEIPPGTPQDESQATKAPKLRKEDGRIDFDRPAGEVAAHVCGVTPWPGATCSFVSADGARREAVTLTRARLAEVPVESTMPIPPGQIDERLYVAAAAGWVELLEVKPSSGRRMTWQDFVNGRHVKPGDAFEPPRDDG